MREKERKLIVRKQTIHCEQQTKTQRSHVGATEAVAAQNDAA
jgi:hypothetical protein